jgi:hypothetical protein
MRKIALAVVIVFGLVACKPPTPSYTVTDPKTGEKTEISVDGAGSKDGSVTINGPDGKATVSVTAKGDVPKDLPTYIPAYPGATYEGTFASNMQATADKGAMRAGMVSFKTGDAPDKVLEFYKGAFTRAGLKDRASGDMGGMKMISFTKGENDGEGAQVVATKAETGETQVQVMYSAGQ